MDLDRGRRAVCAAALSAFAASALAAAPAAAGEPEMAAVRVVVPACDGAAFDVDAFAHAVTLELRADGVAHVELVDGHAEPAGPLAPGAPRDVATLRVDASPCTDQATAIDLTLVDDLTQKTVRRRLTVSDLAPGARARVLGIAAAELLRASWKELGMPEAPPPGVPVPPSVRLALLDRATPTPAAPPPPSPATEIAVARRASVAGVADVAVEGRLYPTYGSALIGPAAALSLGVPERVPLRVRLDAHALFGTSYDKLGSVAVALVGGGASLLLAKRAGALDVEVGPRLMVGWGEASGGAAAPGVQASSGSGAIVELSALVAVRFSLVGAYWASLATDVGGILYGLNASADGRRVAGFGGPSGGLAIGLGRGF